MTTDIFDTRPQVKNKLNVLPNNPESKEGEVVGPGRFPSWLHRKIPEGKALAETSKGVSRLHTVCEEAKCPNMMECWSAKTATFLVMGKECTRSCGFCEIDFSKKPKALEADEPARVVESVRHLGLKHVVITMVARDDQEDGGAAHLASIVRELRKDCPDVTIELLTSDFEGKKEALDLILESAPDVFNHNIETVRSLTPRVRHKATYDRTLEVLAYCSGKVPFVKSGLMVGLGETIEEVKETIEDLHRAGVSIITIGQYLQASRLKLRVKEFVHPEQFAAYAAYGRAIGVKEVYAGPFVRSSYNAGEVFKEVNNG